MNRDIKIIVCCHKADPNIRRNDIYMPLHVGKSISNQDLGFQGDDTGINISHKNRNYCELTGQYWAWKNLNCKYIGLVHYRRYFDINDSKILLLMQKYDIVLTTPTKMVNSAQNMLLRFCSGEDYCILMLVIKKLYPDYYADAIRHFENNEYSRFNMFVASKHISDSYSQWLFSIFEEMEKYVRLSSYSRAARLYGYLSEHLISIWCSHNKLKIGYRPVIDFTRNGRYDFIKNFMADLIFNLRKVFSSKDRILAPDYCFMVGLKNDGILDRINKA